MCLSLGPRQSFEKSPRAGLGHRACIMFRKTWRTVMEHMFGRQRRMLMILAAKGLSKSYLTIAAESHINKQICHGDFLSLVPESQIAKLRRPTPGFLQLWVSNLKGTIVCARGKGNSGTRNLDCGQQIHMSPHRSQHQTSFGLSNLIT